jgi:two-component system sensor histidine kinase DesK
MSKKHSISELVCYFLLCGGLMSVNGFHTLDLTYLLIMVILSGLCLLLQKGTWLFIGILILLSFLWPTYYYFFPYVFRSARISKNQDRILLVILCLLLIFSPHSWPIRIVLILLVCSASYLKMYSFEFHALQRKFNLTKDTTWEKEIQLRQQNEQLKISQETELALQIAEERNRIARDIHDNVGHLLSSAILQVGAMEAINQSDSLHKPLDQLSHTLHLGMNRIRESVHDLHAHSLPFPQALDFLLTDFQFCPVEVIGTPPDHLTQIEQNVLITVIKEALTNIMKHSCATKVTLHFKQLPAFYRLQIKNDGTGNFPTPRSGIGLQTMRQRINQANGQLHIVQKENLFQLTIILPKEDCE